MPGSWTDAFLAAGRVLEAARNRHHDTAATAAAWLRHAHQYFDGFKSVHRKCLERLLGHGSSRRLLCKLLSVPSVRFEFKGLSGLRVLDAAFSASYGDVR